MVNVLVSPPERTYLREQPCQLAETDIARRLDGLSRLGFDKIGFRLFKMYSDQVLNVEEIAEILDNLEILTDTQILPFERKDGYSELAVNCMQNVAVHLDKYTQFAMYFSADFQLLDMNLLADKSSLIRLAERIIGGGIASTARYVILVSHRSEGPEPNAEDNILMKHVTAGLQVTEAELLDYIIANCDLAYSTKLDLVFDNRRTNKFMEPENQSVG